MSAGWQDVPQRSMHETRWRTEEARHQPGRVTDAAANLEDRTIHLLALGTQATAHSIYTIHSGKHSIILFPALLTVAGSTSSGARCIDGGLPCRVKWISRASSGQRIQCVLMETKKGKIKNRRARKKIKALSAWPSRRRTRRRLRRCASIANQNTMIQVVYHAMCLRSVWPVFVSAQTGNPHF